MVKINKLYLGILFVLFLSGCTEVNSLGIAEVSDVSVTQSSETSAEEVEPLPKFSYMYKTLPTNEQIVYREIYRGILNREETIKITGTLTSDKFEKLYNFLLNQEPALYMVSDMIEYSVLARSGYVNCLYVNYRYSERDMDIADVIFREYAFEVNKQCEGETDKEKVQVIHDFIIKNTKYGEVDANCDSIYGVFVDSTATCSGYAKAFQYLCDQQGIQCINVTGYAEGSHMWNLVYLDGEWYAVDCTWDDPDYRDKGIYYYDYFMLSIEEMNESHEMDTFYSDFLKKFKGD